MAMRLGAEDKRKRFIAMILVAVALTLISHTIWKLATRGYSPPAAPPAQAAESGSQAGSNGGGNGSGHAARHLKSAAALDPTLHPEWMALAENTRYSGTSRNIFSKNSRPPSEARAIEKPIAPVRTSAAAVDTGPPPPPAIQLKFYGFATEKNGRTLVFLLHGEDVFIAGQGDVVDGRYKVVRIGSNSVVVKDLAYNDEQTLTLQTA